LAEAAAASSDLFLAKAVLTASRNESGSAAHAGASAISHIKVFFMGVRVSSIEMRAGPGRDSEVVAE
jgi:hypothetical protein